MHGPRVAGGASRGLGPQFGTSLRAESYSRRFPQCIAMSSGSSGRTGGMDEEARENKSMSMSAQPTFSRRSIARVTTDRPARYGKR